MTAGGALCSDHVNYLIFRYLQEAGHENTATAFYRDWHRPADFRDPENYPWAGAVRRNELVSIIQSGLHQDELEARVRKNERKYRFTYANERGGISGVFENGMRSERPTSSGAKRKGRPPSIARPPPDFPTPPPKRIRTSGGSEHLNGDAMEVDAASPSADADDDGDAVSPAIASEPEMTDIPERYDSMDVAVQTDVKTSPKTSTLYCKLDKPGALIYHSVFGPTVDANGSNALLAVGESLCRFYQIPEDASDVKQIESIDDPSLPPNSVVTASAWHPKGSTAVFAVDTVRETSDGRGISRQLIFSRDRNTGNSTHYELPTLLNPSGVVMALRYSPDGSKLLTLETNTKRGMVVIYDTSLSIKDSPIEEDEKGKMLAWHIFDHQIVDANWSHDSQTFIVCGNDGTCEACALNPNSVPSEPTSAETNGDKMSEGLIQSTAWLPDSEKQRHYEKIRVNSSGAVALVSGSGADKKLLAAQYRADEASRVEFGNSISLQDTITALAFQPEIDVDSTQPRFLATTFFNGSCVIYSYVHHSTSVESSEPRGDLKPLLTFQLSSGPALALAWSADGSYLAVAGMDLVQIWDMKTLVRREGEQVEIADAPHEALVTWRSDASGMGVRNGEHEESRTMSEPSLSWSGDGESLAFAVEKQIAIIRFRPPLHEVVENAETNGHISP